MECDVRLCDEGVQACYVEGISLVSFVFILTFIARLRVYFIRSQKRSIVTCGSLLPALV